MADDVRINRRTTSKRTCAVGIRHVPRTIARQIAAENVWITSMNGPRLRWPLGKVGKVTLNHLSWAKLPIGQHVAIALHRKRAANIVRILHVMQSGTCADIRANWWSFGLCLVCNNNKLRLKWRNSHSPSWQTGQGNDFGGICTKRWPFTPPFHRQNCPFLLHFSCLS